MNKLLRNIVAMVVLLFGVGMISNAYSSGRFPGATCFFIVGPTEVAQHKKGLDIVAKRVPGKVLAADIPAWLAKKKRGGLRLSGPWAVSLALPLGKKFTELFPGDSVTVPGRGEHKVKSIEILKDGSYLLKLE